MHLTDSGWSILHVAAEHCDIEIINEMSKLGANLNVKDTSGTPAIFYALDKMEHYKPTHHLLLK